MNLLAYGNGVQAKEWKVEESKPVGYCRIYYIANGKVRYSDENGERQLKHGFLYIFPSVKKYEIHHDSKHPIDCLWWHMDVFPTVISDLIELEAEAGSSFRYLLETLKRYFMENGGKAASFHSMVYALVEYCCDHNWIPQPDGKIPQIIEYIDTHYNQSMSIEEISRHFNYTKEHFIRLFQKATNFTPYQYLIYRRMREAEKLLLQNMSVKETAAAVGYQDAKVFAHRFKQIFLIAPSQYKEFYKPMA